MRWFHRWIGIPASLLMIFIALTGVLLHLDMIRVGASPPGPPPALASSMAAAPGSTGKADYHFILQDLHAGYFMGWPGRILSILGGSILLVLAVTGFKVYWDMYARRRRSGHHEVFWR